MPSLLLRMPNGIALIGGQSQNSPVCLPATDTPFSIFRAVIIFTASHAMQCRRCSLMQLCVQPSSFRPDRWRPGARPGAAAALRRHSAPCTGNTAHPSRNHQSPQPEGRAGHRGNAHRMRSERRGELQEEDVVCAWRTGFW